MANIKLSGKKPIQNQSICFYSQVTALVHWEQEVDVIHNGSGKAFDNVSHDILQES